MAIIIIIILIMAIIIMCKVLFHLQQQRVCPGMEEWRKEKGWLDVFAIVDLGCAVGLHYTCHVSI